MRTRAGSLLLLLPAASAFAHGGVDHHSAAAALSAADAWNIVTAISLIVITALYFIGVRHVWRTSIQPWQAGSFAIGCASAAIALLSPLDRWSDVLFSAHMAQHEILMLVSAPLMVLGRPFIASMWALPAGARRGVAGIAKRRAVVRAWELSSGAFTVLVLHAVVLWIWHVPAMFEAALHNESIHVVQHLGFFVTAALFWWALVHGRYGRMGYGVGVAYVFATAMHTQILGALLTFGPRSWYPTHASRTLAAGINPVDDQQLAGIVMWVPFGVVFVFVALALFAAWLGEAERRVAFTSSERLALAREADAREGA